MSPELIRQLSGVTEEERRILSGNGVDQRLYSKSGDFIIESRKMLSDGRLIDIRPHTRFVRFPRHRHNYVEIIYMCSGKTVHTVNGGNRVVLETGNLLFFNQYCVHEIEPAGQGDVAVNFIVLPDFFEVALRMIGGQSMIGSFLVNSLCRSGIGGEYLHFKVADVVPVQNLVENLVWSIVNRQSNGNRINETTMGLLLMQLMNYTERLDHSGPDRFEKRLVMRSLEYIEENYRQATLTQLSEVTGQSMFKLSRLIKSETGSNFKTLLLQKRLSRACELLGQTDLSVSDIIFSVGYDNTSYFYRAFRERYGRSPSKYREDQRMTACK